MALAKRVQRRRGSASAAATFTGALGEFTYDTTLKTIRAHDGSTAGGFIVLRKNADGSIPLGQFTISADGTSLLHAGGSANMRIKNGQIQLFDATAYAADNTKPWRSLGCDNGQIILSDPIAI